MYTTSDQEPKPGEYPLQAREVWHEGFAESCTPGREQLAGLFFRSCSNHFNRNPRYSYGCDRCACSRCDPLRSASRSMAGRCAGGVAGIKPGSFSLSWFFAREEPSDERICTYGGGDGGLGPKVAR